jgi:subtilisin family serine protease
MVNDGIIVVTSAGNNFAKCDVPSGIDYNNYFTIFGYDLYYMRGSSPNTESSISVGSIASLKINGGECKTEYSNCGPAVDVYAPGDAIMSSVLACQGFPCMVDERDYLNYPDHRYGFDKYTGTSMSGPQVTGMLACIASSNTSLNQDSAKAYISTNSKSTITNGTIFRDLQGSPNRYLYYSGASVHYP